MTRLARTVAYWLARAADRFLAPRVPLEQQRFLSGEWR